MKVVTLKAEPREPNGTSTARRLRRTGRLPGVVYGEGLEPRHVTFETKAFSHALEHGARVLDLQLDGVGAARVLLKDVQYDALGRKLVHADFLRLHPDHELTIGIPLDLRGTPAGVAAGGILMVLRDNVQVRCLPNDIPERIELQIAELALGESLTAGDVPLPEKVALADEPTAVIITVSVPRGLDSDEPGEGEDEGEGDEAAASDSSEG